MLNMTDIVQLYFIAWFYVQLYWMPIWGSITRVLQSTWQRQRFPPLGVAANLEALRHAGVPYLKPSAMLTY